jgi:small subunit ribosomal protein S1
VHPGKVRRVTDFGAFVELTPGVEALAPAGEFPPSRTGWRDKIQPGTERDWLVLSVDAESRRISLTIPVEGTNGDTLPAIEAGASLSGQVQRLESYGVFVWLGPGRVGLMPRSLCGLPPHVELERRFGIGDPIEVQVVDVQDGGRRIRLSARGVDPRLIKAESETKPRRRRPDRMRERRSDRAPAGQTFSEAPNAFGQSLGDKLRAALGRTEDGP